MGGIRLSAPDSVDQDARIKRVPVRAMVIVSATCDLVIAISYFHLVNDANLLTAANQPLVRQIHHGEDESRSRPPKTTVAQQTTQFPARYFLARVICEEV
jgi:hypothetical protein